MVGDRPVIVCWGYEKEAANALLPAALPRPPVAAPSARKSVLEAPAVTRSLLALRPASTVIPWARTLAAALPLLLLLLGGAWLLRGLLPADPALALATREGPPAPPALEAAPDPKPALKVAFSTEEARGRALKVELSLIEAELKKRITDCKPPEAPKPPPQVALAPPPAAQPPKPAPAPAPAPPPRPAPRPNDDRLRLPSAPSNDYSFMQGCWRTDPFSHETIQPQPGISSYCFDSSGNGQPRMAARPHRLPHAGVLTLRGRGPQRCATPTRPATTARTGTPTSWSAAAAPTMWRDAAARRAARSARSPGRSICTS